MEERVDKLLPYGYTNLWVSTFHSFCQKILEDYSIEIGLPEFKILDDTQRWLFFRKNFEKSDMKERGIAVCRKCHSFLHKQFSEKYLGRELNTLEKILENETVQNYARWARKRQRSPG